LIGCACLVHTFPFGNPAPLRATVRVGSSAHGTELEFRRDDQPVGTWRDGTFPQGRVVLGIFPDQTGKGRASERAAGRAR
jgi:hypothetical protein